MSEVLTLFGGETLDMKSIGDWFDAATPAARLEGIRAIGKRGQRQLYEAAPGHGVVDLEFMVPASCGTLSEVIHEGHNSLPMFSYFQKRFCRTEGDANTLAGYNEQGMRWATGPGYFQARVEGDEVAIDYRELPTERCETWPEIMPQTARLGRLVYADMVDMIRRVSNHVTVGRAIRKGKETENYFLLCRQDP